MESLRDTLEKVTHDNKRAKKLRRYIVVEAVYQVTSIQYDLFCFSSNLPLGVLY